jgi:hypothetical protein
MTHTHTLTRTYTHLTLCHGHTLFIVTDAHHHVDRGLYTYMTSYLAQVYRLSTLIDKTTPFINSWLIRLWVDNVLLINTRCLSIVIDKTELLKLQKSGQFPDDPVKIKDAQIHDVNSQTYYLSKLCSTSSTPEKGKKRSVSVKRRQMLFSDETARAQICLLWIHKVCCLL